MAIEQFLNEAETIYKLVLARQIDIDLAVYMAQRLEQRSKIAAQYLICLCLIKPQFKRAFLINDFILKKWLQLNINKTHSPIL